MKFSLCAGERWRQKSAFAESRTLLFLYKQDYKFRAGLTHTKNSPCTPPKSWIKVPTCLPRNWGFVVRKCKSAQLCNKLWQNIFTLNSYIYFVCFIHTLQKSENNMIIWFTEQNKYISTNESIFLHIEKIFFSLVKNWKHRFTAYTAKLSSFRICSHIEVALQDKFSHDRAQAVSTSFCQNKSLSRVSFGKPLSKKRCEPWVAFFCRHFQVLGPVCPCV